MDDKTKILFLHCVKFVTKCSQRDFRNNTHKCYGKNKTETT